MPQPPTQPVIGRDVVRPQPYCAQRTWPGVNAVAPFAPTTIAVAGSLSCEFDVAFGITDDNQLQAGLYPAGNATPVAHATGPWLDAVMWINEAAGTGSILVEYAVDQSCGYHAPVPAMAVPGQTLVNISALRITGRFARVTFANTGAVLITVEIGAYVRSA